jgi:glutaredoxin
MTEQGAAAVVYTRPGCAPCFALKRLAARAARRHGVRLSTVDITGDAGLEAAYGARVPVLLLPGGIVLEGRVEAAAVERAFRDAGAGGPRDPARGDAGILRRLAATLRAALKRSDGAARSERR